MRARRRPPACHQWQPIDGASRRREACAICGARCQRDRVGRIVAYARADEFLDAAQLGASLGITDGKQEVA